MKDPCNDCLVKAMCSEICQQKKWQMEAIHRALSQHIQAYQNCHDERGKRYYTQMLNKFRDIERKAEKTWSKIRMRSNRSDTDGFSSSSSRNSSASYMRIRKRRMI